RGGRVTPRIAVLDDEARLVAILEMVLRRGGYEVEGFSAPETALAALGARRFDLLLSDLKLPGLDGLDVLERLRAVDPDLPAGMMPAQPLGARAVGALKLGAFDSAEKPFENDALRAVVAGALEHSRLARKTGYLRAERASRHGTAAIVAESPALLRVLELVR